MDKESIEKITEIHSMLVKEKIPQRVATLEERSKNHTYQLRTFWGLLTTGTILLFGWLLDKMGVR